MNLIDDGRAESANEARVETRGGCTLVFGSLGLSQLRVLTRDGSPDDVLSPDLARLVGANFAYGSAAAVEALTAQARAQKLAAERPAKLHSLEKAAQDWAVAGEVSASSATIFAWMTGIKLDLHGSLPRTIMPVDYPHDPSDLRRCRLLLEAVPSFAERFKMVMRPVSLTWEALVNQWPSICNAMDRECPEWRSPSGYAVCLETYRLMHMVVESAGRLA